MSTQVHRHKVYSEVHPLENAASKSLAVLNFAIAAFLFYSLWKVAAPWRPFITIALLFPIQLLSSIAWKIGRIFRDFSAPHSFFAHGAQDSFKKKIFWITGPQFIASFWTIVIAWFIGLSAIAPRDKHLSPAPPPALSAGSEKIADKEETSLPPPALSEQITRQIPVPTSPSHTPDVPSSPMRQAPSAPEIFTSQDDRTAEFSELHEAENRPVTAPQTEAGAPIETPSFDCEKATSIQEHLICNNPRLAALDRQLATAYTVLMTQSDNRPELRQAQLNWLKQGRGACRTMECLEQAYRSRLDDLDVLKN